MNTTFDISPRVEIEEKLRAYAKRLELLGEIDRAGILARTKHEIALATLNSISELIGCDRASITEVDVANHSHAVLAVAPQGQTTIAVGRTFRLEHWKAVMDNLKRGIHYVADLDQVHARTPLQEEIYREGVRSYLSVPLSQPGQDSWRAQSGLISAQCIQRKRSRNRQRSGSARGHCSTQCSAIRRTREQSSTSGRAFPPVGAGAGSRETLLSA